MFSSVMMITPSTALRRGVMSTSKFTIRRKNAISNSNISIPVKYFSCAMKKQYYMSSSIVKRSYTSSSYMYSNNNNDSFWSMSALDPINDIILYPSNADDNNDRSIKSLSTNIVWNSYSDKEYGGSSTSQVISSSSIPNNNNNNSNNNHYIIFQGNINYQEIIAKDDIKSSIKGSFCAITGKLSKSIDLRDYEGFEIELESVNNDIVLYFNTKYQSFIEDDLYQVEIHLKKNKRKIFHIPFSKFRLMGKGVEKEYQRLNDSLILESVGFMTMLKEENNVDFAVRISRIKAIHVINDRLLQNTLFVNKM